MPLTGTGTVWGTAVKTAVEGLSVPQTTQITSGELESFWQAICAAHVTHITANALPLSAGATLIGPAGGPLPIAALPGVIT